MQHETAFPLSRKFGTYEDSQGQIPAVVDEFARELTFVKRLYKTFL
jgi:hypothetical protein